MTKIHNISCLFMIIGLLSWTSSMAQQLAFPTAEGFGRYTSGGRGGEVYEVTNLNDTGQGSLRTGIDMSGPRTIVFRVSGTIELKSELRIENGDLTIAGHTAPGDGIAIKGYGTVVDADNIIIRYIRFRPGDISGGEPDAVWGRNQRDIILDHCTMSWGVDEVASFYDNENFTMQWCLLSESLYESQHEKGRHGYGGIWGGQGATFHHNILAHHSSRNPRFNGSRYSGQPDLEIVDYRNNVIYNWGGNSAYGGEEGNQNMVSNYYKPGPATSSSKRYRIIEPSYPLGKWHVTGNYVDGYPDVTSDNWDGGVQGVSAEDLAVIREDQPFDFAPVTTQTAEEAYEIVLENCGAILPQRDPVDARIINEIATGTVTYGGAYGADKGIIDSQEHIGGWPTLFSAPPPDDSDHDGVPDTWETDNGLDPDDPADGKLINETGYSNLESYLIDLESQEPADFLRYPSDLEALETTNTSISLKWKDNEENETSIILDRALEDLQFEVIATLDADVTEYTDTELEPGVEYFYRLKVVTETQESLYTPIFSVYTQAIPLAPHPENLVGYWSFNETSGTNARDGSEHGNHADLVDISNPQWVTGKADNALDLTSGLSSAHIEVAHEDQLNLDNQSFSVAFWLKADAQSSETYLFHKGSFAANSGTGATGKWFGLQIKDGQLRFVVDDNITKTEATVSSSEFTTGEWVNIVVLRDTDRSVLAIYKDGELLQEVTDQTNEGIGEASPLIIGNSSDLNTPFIGTIDEFQVYGHRLNAPEIAALYQGYPLQTDSPSPEHEAEGVSPQKLTLIWEGYDALEYNLYLGETAENLELEEEDLTDNFYAVGDLNYSAQYYWRVDAVGFDGAVTAGSVWTFSTPYVPLALSDKQAEIGCYPNPFTDELHLMFHLDGPGTVKVLLYDMSNRLHKVLVNTHFDQGAHTVLQQSGHEMGLKPGMYLCVFELSGKRFTEKLIFRND